VLLDQPARVHDRRDPEPDEQADVQQVTDVAVPNVQRRDPRRERAREHEQRGERQRQQREVRHAQADGRDDEDQQHDHLQPVVDERHADRRERQDLARERDLLDQVRVVDHRPRTSQRGGREQVPRQQAREEVDGVVRQPIAEHTRDEREHGQVHEGIQQRPDRAEHRGHVLDLQLLADQVGQDLAVRDQHAQALADPKMRRFGGALDGLDGVSHALRGRAPARPGPAGRV
jgi:hypothetical protein